MEMKFNYAAGTNNLKLVHELLKNDLVDPANNNNYALTIALLCEHEKMAKLLLSDDRVLFNSLDNALLIAKNNGMEEIATIIDKHCK